MYTADEEERKFLRAENEKAYKQEMEAQAHQENGDEIFSVRAFIDFIKTWKCT